jgi:predicted protein tyrosine phosphatase
MIGFMTNPFPLAPLTPIHAIQVPKGPRLSVTDLDRASRDHGSYDAVISLLDPGMVLEWTHPRHHCFWVSDREEAGPTAPDAAFVVALLEIHLAGASKVLVHCHGGYSRSPAAAMLLAWKLGARQGAIEKGINWRKAYPNRLILGLGEACLDTGGSLWALAVRKAGG